VSVWVKLTEEQRLILRDCFAALRLTGRMLSLLGDVILQIRRSEMAPLCAELEAMQDEVSGMDQRLTELRGRLQVLSKAPPGQ
jgi:hypothetical protein